MEDNRTFLKFVNVSYKYPAGVQALDNVSFTVHQGEKVGLVGLNGSGKSTLMLCTVALLSPDSGEIYVDDTKITTKNYSTARKRIGLVFQNSDDQLFMPTVEEDVAFGPRNMKLDEKEVERRVEEALALTGCTELKSRAPFRLSGGQKRMVSVATILSMQPEMLVLDEPTSALDYVAQDQLTEILRNLNHTMMISSHDLDFIRTICHRVIVMKEGRVIYDGNVTDMPYPPSDSL